MLLQCKYIETIKKPKKLIELYFANKMLNAKTKEFLKYVVLMLLPWMVY